LNRAVLDHAVDQLAQVMAYLAPYGPQSPCFSAVNGLRCREFLKAFLGPWACAQAPVATALGLTEYNWFAARMVGARDECITGFGSDHRVVSSVMWCIGAVVTCQLSVIRALS